MTTDEPGSCDARASISMAMLEVHSRLGALELASAAISLSLKWATTCPAGLSRLTASTVARGSSSEWVRTRPSQAVLRCMPKAIASPAQPKRWKKDKAYTRNKRKIDMTSLTPWDDSFLAMHRPEP